MNHSRVFQLLRERPDPCRIPFTLTTALEAARAAAEVIRHYYQRNVQVTLKADKSPVTTADIDAEQTIRQILAQSSPGHGFMGDSRVQSWLPVFWVGDPSRDHASCAVSVFSGDRL